MAGGQARFGQHKRGGGVPKLLSTHPLRTGINSLILPELGWDLINGKLQTTGHPGMVITQLGAALQCTSANYVKTPTLATVSDTVYTWEMLFQVATAGGGGAFIMQSSDGFQPGFYEGYDGNLNGQGHGSSSYSPIDSGVACSAAGTLLHAVYTWDGTTASLYVNGKLTGTNTGLGTPDTYTTLNLQPSAGTYNYLYFRSWHNRRLRPSEIQELYFNPYGMLRWPEDVLFGSRVGAGGGSSSISLLGASLGMARGFGGVIGAAAFSGAAVGKATGRANTAAKAALAGALKGAATGRAGASGTLPLGGMSRGAAVGNVSLAGRVALAAFSKAQAAGRAVASAVQIVALFGRGFAKASGFLAPAGKASLSASGSAAVTGAAAPIGKISFAGRAQGQGNGSAHLNAAASLAGITQAAAKGAASFVARVALSGAAKGMATSRGVLGGVAVLYAIAGAGKAMATGRAILRALLPIFADPRAGSQVSRRVFGASIALRNFGSIVPTRKAGGILGVPMPQAPDASTMDIGEIVNGWIDFAKWLPGPASISSISSVTVANYSPPGGSPYLQLVGSAAIGTVSVAQGGSGISNMAVLQQWQGLAVGTARITITVATSDGQTLTGWIHQMVSQPN